MSIFKRKEEKIEIIVPLEGNLSVQDFADKHAKPNTSIDVEVHGSLWKSTGNLVSVKFVPRQSRDQIGLAFVEAFKTRNPIVGRRLMFCN